MEGLEGKEKEREEQKNPKRGNITAALNARVNLRCVLTYTRTCTGPTVLDPHAHLYTDLHLYWTYTAHLYWTYLYWTYNRTCPGPPRAPVLDLHAHLYWTYTRTSHLYWTTRTCTGPAQPVLDLHAHLYWTYTLGPTTACTGPAHLYWTYNRTCTGHTRTCTGPSRAPVLEHLLDRAPVLDYTRTCPGPAHLDHRTCTGTYCLDLHLFTEPTPHLYWTSTHLYWTYTRTCTGPTTAPVLDLHAHLYWTYNRTCTGPTTAPVLDLHAHLYWTYNRTWRPTPHLYWTYNLPVLERVPEPNTHLYWTAPVLDLHAHLYLPAPVLTSGPTTRTCTGPTTAPVPDYTRTCTGPTRAPVLDLHAHLSLFSPSPFFFSYFFFISPSLSCSPFFSRLSIRPPFSSLSSLYPLPRLPPPPSPLLPPPSPSLSSPPPLFHSSSLPPSLSLPLPLSSSPFFPSPSSFRSLSPLSFSLFFLPPSLSSLSFSPSPFFLPLPPSPLSPSPFFPSPSPSRSLSPFSLSPFFPPFLSLGHQVSCYHLVL
ncbi:hypothetical protein C7M84_000071 [Penaeus vannamei]|uniref:Uncharacterized protein n=1 Tax=Penaeus vannamei TaxID=6689 RepID=A0A3R7MGM4_PENVA|nr:hypothetical protein C7M84_000071 [Penaeus vannamei]